MTKMDKKIQDAELGEIILRRSPRAKRYSIKISKGKVIGILPEQMGEEQKMLAFIHEQRAKIKETLQRHPQPALLNEQTILETAAFSVHIFCTDRTNFYLSLKNKELHIACPLKTPFEREEVQALLRQMLERALRHEAKRLLPQRLMALAAQYHFTCTGVKINSSRTHWGSCTPRKSINLSLSLLLLPWHLIDYVLLHELCHTIEMNHSDRFWTLMNQVTNGQALRLRQELKTHRML